MQQPHRIRFAAMVVMSLIATLTVILAALFARPGNALVAVPGAILVG